MTPLAILIPIGLLAAALGGFLVYVVVRYAPVVGRVFEEQPLFQPLRLTRLEGGEDVRFPTADGLDLAGTYFRARAPQRAGVVLFCHEYLGDRWSFRPYADDLRDLGYDVFTFDFRNHGDSATDPSYRPLQWVSDLELTDVRGAIAYLQSRPDRDPAGVGLYGISRGGGAALCVAADEPAAWGVVTDGAFPTRGTVLTYVLRWAEIYVANPVFWKYMPTAIFAFVGWAGRVRAERRRGRKYADVERAAARLSPRPWLQIHGERDGYIGPQIARELNRCAREPKELWLVPQAKHNRCREVDPAGYRAQVEGYFRRWAPRRPAPAPIADEAQPAPLAPSSRPTARARAAVTG